MGLRAWAAWQNGQAALGARSLLALEWQSAGFNPGWPKRSLCLPTENLSPVHFIPRYMCLINCVSAVDFFPLCLWQIKQLLFGPLALGVWSDSSCPTWWSQIHRSMHLLPNHQQLLEICYKMWCCPSIFHMAFNFHYLLIYSSRYLFNPFMLRCVACNLNDIQNAETKPLALFPKDDSLITNCWIMFECFTYVCTNSKN